MSVEKFIKQAMVILATETEELCCADIINAQSHTAYASDYSHAKQPSYMHMLGCITHPLPGKFYSDVEFLAMSFNQ